MAKKYDEFFYIGTVSVSKLEPKQTRLVLTCTLLSIDFHMIRLTTNRNVYKAFCFTIILNDYTMQNFNAMSLL